MGGGKFCCVVGCSACQVKNRGLSFFSIPKVSGDASKLEWRQRIIAVINRADDSFNPDKAHICSRHFEEDCLSPYGKGRTLKVGSIPTKFLPKKSVETPTSLPRKEPTFRATSVLPTVVKYYSIAEVEKDVSVSLRTPWFLIPTTDNSVHIGALDDDFHLKYRVLVNPDLKAHVHFQGMLAKVSSIEQLSIHKFLQEVIACRTCPGIPDPHLQGYAPLPTGFTPYFRHILNHGRTHTSTVRATKCTLICEVSNDLMCGPCREVRRKLEKRHNDNAIMSSKPFHKNTPISTSGQKRLLNEIKIGREKEHQLQKELEKIKLEFQTEAVIVESDLHNKLKQSIEEGTIKDPLAKVFWEEQLKAFASTDRGMRWHPMMIRLAILLRCQSPAVYRTLRNTGVLKLPGDSTLKDYTNAIQPREGFCANVLDELCNTVKDAPENKRFVVLLHDEMTIKHDLVFDRRSGDVIGFINPNKWGETGGNLATHVLTFMVVGIATNIKMSLGFVSTITATADELYPLMWEAIGLLEICCGLKVIASTSDKATPNQKLYRLHREEGEELCYKAVNIFNPDRFVYFLSDAPHLIKTVRNNLAASGYGKNTRLLWNGGSEILWKHIIDIYRRDADSVLSRTRLTSDHVHLTPFSVMNVRLAAQVLSHKVSAVMRAYGGEDCQETARFLGLMDRFFDCLNGRYVDEGDRKRKPDLRPYRSPDDDRFKFLQEQFLGYLEQWKRTVNERPGNYTKGERSKMFLSYQTYEGLQMTVHAFIGATKYLLNQGVEYVLSNVFCQDPLEQHFGRHRGMGRRADNPNLWTFGYQEQRIRLQRDLAIHMQPRGNIFGPKQTDREAVRISTSPMKKIRRL